jgi:dolichol-phosphate mannosyltransferase
MDSFRKKPRTAGRQAASLPLVAALGGRLMRHRFIRFGTVGFSGTIVNLLVLYLNQEFVFSSIHSPESRLRVSLAIAILISTLSNYIWNRAWTWGQRRLQSRYAFVRQMGKYYLACGTAIVLQYLFTSLLSGVIHYLAANVTAIVLAAVFSYLLNDLWTFSLGNSAPFSILDRFRGPRTMGSDDRRLV